MKNSRVLGFIAVVLILLVGIGILFSADFSDLYLGTAYKRLLVLRNDTALTGLNATTPERVYDGAFTASPFSLSQEEMLFDTDKQLQFRNDNMFIHSDATTTLTIDGNTDLKLTGTAITMSGIVSCGNFITTGGGTSVIDNIPIGKNTQNTGAFTTLTASGTIIVDGVATFRNNVAIAGDASLNGGTLIYNDSGADLDARFEGDTSVNLLFLDAGNDRIGINTATPSATLDIVGTLEVSSTSVFTGTITATGGVTGDLTGDVSGNITSTGTSYFSAMEISNTLKLSNDLSFVSADIQMDSGNGIYFDAAGNTGFVSNSSGNINCIIGGTNELTVTSTAIYPTTDNGLSLGIDASREFLNIYANGAIDSGGTLASGTTTTVGTSLTVGTTAIVIGVTTLTGGLNSDGNSDFDDLVTISDLFAFDGTAQDLTCGDGADGVINATTTITQCSISGSNALTIADGATEGQIKIVYVIRETTGTGTLSGANFAGTSVTLDAVGSSINLLWDSVNSEWYMNGAPNNGTYTP